MADTNTDNSKPSADEQKHIDDLEMRRRVEANRGISGGPSPLAHGRNPSGTFSEPTPTDIRYPNKDETEFENNHGAFLGKSAAQMRDAAGLPDAPGGIHPHGHIPDDWESLSDDRKIRIAERLDSRRNLDGSPEARERRTFDAAQATDAIKAEIDRRKADPDWQKKQRDQREQRAGGDAKGAASTQARVGAANPVKPAG